MAATARALAGSDEEFVAGVETRLYRGLGAEHFDPGRAELLAPGIRSLTQPGTRRRSGTTAAAKQAK